jgi:hypothetical protein
MTDDNKFYGLYRGICIDNQDPENLNKILLQVPQILGEAVTNWAPACAPVTNNTTHDTHTDVYTSSGTSVSTFGAHTHTVTLNSTHSAHNSVPNVGQLVWVMFIAGDPNFPVWIGV